MKFILLSLFVGLGICMPDGGDTNTVANHPVLSTIFGKATQVPGATRSGFQSGGSGAMCIVSCMLQMNTKIQSDSELSGWVEKQSKPMRFEKNHDKALVTKFCKITNESVTCVDPCEQSDMKRLTQRAQIVSNHMCRDTRFVEYSPCYEKVDNQMISVCHSNDKCGHQKAAIENSFANQPRNLQDFGTMLKHHCEYEICYSNCERDKVVQECGNDANKALEGLYKKSTVVMKQLFETLGLNIAMPSECSPLLNDDDD